MLISCGGDTRRYHRHRRRQQQQQNQIISFYNQNCDREEEEDGHQQDYHEEQNYEISNKGTAVNDFSLSETGISTKSTTIGVALHNADADADTANKWEYLAEGGANVIFRRRSDYDSDSGIDRCWGQYVLRVPKTSSSSSQPIFRHSYVDVLKYITKSILPIMNNTITINSSIHSNNMISNIGGNNEEDQKTRRTNMKMEDDTKNEHNKYKLYGTIVFPTETFVNELDDILQSTILRPTHRCVSTLATGLNEKTPTGAGGKATITPMMMLPNVITKGQICTVEIKPKSSLRPSKSQQQQKMIPRFNPTISDYGMMKQRTCRYCMHQEYKKQCGTISQIDVRPNTKFSYCPMDLFSNTKSKMKKAIRSLMDKPQNNLKMFLPPDMNSNKDDDVDNTKGKNNDSEHNAESNDVINRTISRTAALTETVAMALKKLNDDEIIKKNVLIDVVVEGLYQSGVLNDIRRAQELDQLDIEGIWDLKQLVDSCTNLEDGSLPIPNKHLFSATVPTIDTIDVDDNRGENDNLSTFQKQQIRQNQPRQQQHQQQYKSFHRRRRLSLLEAIGCNAETSSLNEIRKNYQRVLDNFLLSSTMKDCSVLLSIRRENKGFVAEKDHQEAKQYHNTDANCCDEINDDHGENLNHGNRLREMEYRIACEKDDDYDYYVLVSIIDLDKKPASKLQKYHALDKQIVNYYSASYGLHHKLCFNDDGCDVTSSHKVVRIKGNMQIRLLYPNPVCLLTVYDMQSTPAANVMTITWLTPIDNNGTFVCSINKKRHTASTLDVSSIFVLNIPSRDMEQQILNIGSCSGRDIDKFQQLGLNVCCPGWLSSLTMVRDDDERTVVKNAIALSDCIAHTVCKVLQKQDQGQHWLLVCKQQLSWSRSAYFDGKRFRPNDSSLSPYLTFLGSQTFGYVECDT